MKKFVSSIGITLLLVLPFMVQGQYALQQQWAKAIGGNLGHRNLQSMEMLGDKFLFSGFIYITDLEFGCTTNSNGNAWLLVTDLNGNKMWSQCYGGSSGDVFKRAYFGKNNDIWAAGGFSSTNGDFPNNGYLNKLAIVRFDSLGNSIWNKFYGSTLGENSFTDFTATSDGGAIFSLDFSYAGGDIPYKNDSNPFSTDTWLCKIDTNGAIQWSLVLGGTGHEQSTKVRETETGKYTVLINTTSTDSMLTGLNHNNSAYCSWLVEVDTGGHVLSSRVVQGTGNTEGAELFFDFMPTPDRGVLLVGGGNPDSGDYCFPGHGAGDFISLKADSNYQHEWCRVNGGRNDDALYQVIWINDSIVAVGGRARSDNEDLVHCGPFPLSYTHSHVWFALVNLYMHQTIWQKALCGSGQDYFVALSYDSLSSALYVCTYGSSTDGDFAGAALNDSSNVYLFKYSLVPSGIDEVKFTKPTIKSYPNPFSDEITMELPQEWISGETQIRLMDITGRIVMTTETDGEQKIVSHTSQLSSGMYFINALHEGFMVSGKLIKE